MLPLLKGCVTILRMSLFAREHSMPSWAEVFALIGFGLIGLMVELYQCVKWLRVRRVTIEP